MAGRTPSCDWTILHGRRPISGLLRHGETMSVRRNHPEVRLQEAGAPPPVDVPTSITAFVGRTVRGPVNEPVEVNSWAEYEATFGGLAETSGVSWQVRAFFDNGGRQALVVRLYQLIRPPRTDLRRELYWPKPGEADGCAVVRVGPLVLAANSPGRWGNGLTATVTTGADGTFDLTVTLSEAGGGTRTERFAGLTLDPAQAARGPAAVLAAQSKLVVFRAVASPEADGSGQGAGGVASQPLSMFSLLGDQNAKLGLYALEKAALFNILCIPPDRLDGDTANLIYQTAAEYCEARDAMLIIDPPGIWQKAVKSNKADSIQLAELGNPFGAGRTTNPIARHAAVYFPRIRAPDPLRNNKIRTFPNCGYIAGIWARTDRERGVWTPPAWTTATLNGVAPPVPPSEQRRSDQIPFDTLLLRGINGVLGVSETSFAIWGARTTAGAPRGFIVPWDKGFEDVFPTDWDGPEDDYKYVHVQRVALYMKSWLRVNTAWAASEPNGPALWDQLTTRASDFMSELWKKGALTGATPEESFFVRCDASTITAEDLAAGVANIQIGFAPLKPMAFLRMTVAVRTARPDRRRATAKRSIVAAP
jgi:phage tail sheath protein FI